MKSNSYPVVIKKKQDFFNNDYDITVPQSLVNHLDKDKLPTRVKINSIDVNINCSTNRTDNTVRMSSELLSQLSLFEDIECHATIKSDTLCFGPVIGVFVGKSYIKKLKNQNPRERTIELIKANQHAKTILYFFCIQGVDYKNTKVEGYFFEEESNAWKKNIFPFPDVLYDRGSGKPNKRFPRQKFRNKLERETPAQNFNAQHYFDKYDLYKKLSKFKEMKEHLPKTILYTHPRDLIQFKNKKETYIKKCIGSNGRHIMKIKKLSNNGYKYSLFIKKVVKNNVKHFKDVVNIIDKLYPRNKSVIQEGIKVPSQNGGNIDMRATLQRDGKGDLGITSIVVRVGEKGSPVTSTRTGSTCYRFEEFYEKILSSKEDVQELRNKIDEFLFKVYDCTEKSYDKFGEIGIDFALDKKGKIWFIECNAKPAKDAMYKSYDQQTIRKAFQYPLEYSKYITGFNT